MTRTHFTVLFYLVFALGCVAEISQDEALQFKEIQIRNQTEARFPATMRALGIKEGNVSLVLSIGDSGAISDIFVLESTTQAFAKSALKSIESWAFIPASCNNQPIPSSIRIDLDFQIDEMRSWQTFTAPVETNITLAQRENSPITAAAFENLDETPLPIEISEPQETYEGKATIEFFIDEFGNVRGPRITSATNLPFARLMLETVAIWKFEPPLSNGERTNTMVRQTFTYEDGKLSAAQMN